VADGSALLAYPLFPSGDSDPALRDQPANHPVDFALSELLDAISLVEMARSSGAADLSLSLGMHLNRVEGALCT